jgi:PKD repeat protein
VSHTYKKLGTYTVCRTIWDSTRSCRDTFCAQVVYQKCEANFTYKVSGDTVVFTNTSDTSLLVSWSFGDGTSSTDFSPTHVYTGSNSVKTYSVCLTTYNAARSCSDRQCNTVTIAANGKSCAASFRAYTQGLTASFSNSSSSTSTTTYVWKFGDGDTSHGYHSSHKYAKQGVYNVCLTVADTVLKCSVTYCDSITVDSANNNRCSANFSIKVTNDTTVELKNNSTSLNTFTWYLSNGSTTTAYDASYTILKPGTYTICLAGRDSISGCEDSICKKVTISSKRNCQASFRVAVDTSQKFKLFLINSSSNKSNHSYSWTFGDGGTSAKRNPTHKYKSFGKYNVCLTITDSALNCSSTFCDSLGLDSTGRLLKADGFEIEVIDDFVSVPTITKVDFNIYPNPFYTQFNVSLNGTYDQDAKIEVYNVQGRLVSTNNFDGAGKATINLSQQVNGLYLIRIFDGANYSQTKLIKMSK